MEVIYRDYREYLRGFVAGLNMFTNNRKGSLNLNIYSVSRAGSLQSSIKDVLLENGWVLDEIPKLEEVNRQHLQINLNSIFGAVLPGCNRVYISEKFINILDNEFGNVFSLFGRYEIDDDVDEKTFMFVLEVANERVFIVIGCSLG